MNFLFDFLPILLFFGAYKIYGIYVATAVAIVASILQVSIGWIRTKEFNRNHLITLVIISIFGGLTLILRDDTFIMWKPSVVNWAFAAIFLFSLLFSETTVLEYMMGDQLSLPNNVWKNLTFYWCLFFILSGVLNAYVAFIYEVNWQDLDSEEISQFELINENNNDYANFILDKTFDDLPETEQQEISGLSSDDKRTKYLSKIHQDIWVNFKLFGLMGLTFIFVLLQGVYIAKHFEEPEPQAS